MVALPSYLCAVLFAYFSNRGRCDRHGGSAAGTDRVRRHRPIAELGYAQASFARIAGRAGLSSTRLISYHFAGKRTTEDTLPAPEGSQRDELVLGGIAAILSKGQADGDFRDFDTNTMAWVIRSALDGVHQRPPSTPTSISTPVSAS